MDHHAQEEEWTQADGEGESSARMGPLAQSPSSSQVRGPFKASGNNSFQHSGGPTVQEATGELMLSSMSATIQKICPIWREYKMVQPV